ncbi:MAG: YciI family protein [Bryobacteraceae bacterium]|jgi:hypothetical protein
MKFLSLYTPGPRPAGVPPSKEYMAEMAKLIEESMKSGVLVATGGLMPIAQGARVRHAGDEVTVIDGPFVETKELAGGFAILEAKSKEDALQMVRSFLKVAGDGECELRQIMEPGDIPQPCAEGAQETQA